MDLKAYIIEEPSQWKIVNCFWIIDMNLLIKTAVDVHSVRNPSRSDVGRISNEYI